MKKDLPFGLTLDPFESFRCWYDEAVKSNVLMPDAMTLATASADGIPSARIVLFKGLSSNPIGETGIVFYTNYQSHKADELAVNPHAALVFYWPNLGGLDRQIRTEGRVEKTSREESEAYFRSRPRESQIGAWASEQSRTVSKREILENRFLEFERRYANTEVPCPPHWGGYRLIPVRFEFWISRPGRLHDRFLYERALTKGPFAVLTENWTLKQLAP